MGKTEEERDEVNIRSFLGKMIFSGGRSFNCVLGCCQEEKVRCMYQNDDGKSECINDRRTYKPLGLRVYYCI
jgi:hypothetical protein